MSSSPIGKVAWEDRSKDPPNGGLFLIFPNKTVLVGRDENRNHVAFADLVVSRCHLEIFSVVVDEQYGHPPLVFVRDRGSSNGTAVNGQLIGRGAGLSPSRLLEDGDTITVGAHPHLRLGYTLLMNSCNWRHSYALTQLQRREIEMFKDRYVVTDRTIGDGAHAIVFLAADVETGQHVVCKVHDISRYSRTSKEVERIRQEASLLSTLDHPNILPIKAAFETEQTIYVITELATGGDLYSLLLRYNKLNEWAIRSIMRQVLRGVAYIHSKGVAHRDIKLENILCGVTPQVPYRIMLSDFGDSGIAGPGRLKSKVGTRFYRPPECDVPNQGHGLSVDIWAVGMLSLQLILGYEELPGLDSVVFKSQGEVDTYLSTIFAVLGPQGSISEAGQSFICGCLAYDSNRRPTARQAFYHRWLQNPESDRKMFKRLEADNAISWKPQQVKFPVIEDLTTMPLGGDEGGGIASKRQMALQAKKACQHSAANRIGA
ncbi:kinase-like domain-containing protein [Chaetomium fimeti]|uniref:Kinase-like domain-containing protein n=1 Tax=Chaetomium fimeti TaxID=1854472 RepID=A0AAE0LSQ6_9PEZI|nr:kinase-like domain-containing protein [Chaetomium fimeti]